MAQLTGNQTQEQRATTVLEPLHGETYHSLVTLASSPQLSILILEKNVGCATLPFQTPAKPPRTLSVK